MTSKLQSITADLRRRLESIYGERLVRLVLYGSQAREDAEPASDIDVLVVLKGPVSPCEEIARTEQAVADLCLNRNVVVACVFVSQEQYLHRQNPLLLNVRREGVSV